MAPVQQNGDLGYLDPQLHQESTSLHQQVMSLPRMNGKMPMIKSYEDVEEMIPWGDDGLVPIDTLFLEYFKYVSSLCLLSTINPILCEIRVVGDKL